MKRFSSIFLSLLFVVSISSGCDWLRKIAELPTAAEVENMARAIEEKKKADALDTLAGQPVQDTVPVQKKIEDTAVSSVQTPVAVPQAGPLASLDNAGYKIVPYSPARHKFVQTPEKGYYLMIGYFKSKENAQKVVAKAGKDGFNALILPNLNDASSVALVHTSTSGEMARVLEKASTLSYVPKEAWILECK